MRFLTTKKNQSIIVAELKRHIEESNYHQFTEYFEKHKNKLSEHAISDLSGLANEKLDTFGEIKRTDSGFYNFQAKKEFAEQIATFMNQHTVLPKHTRSGYQKF